MRSVSLSNPTVQKKIEASFIPLKVAIEPGTDKFPLEWPAMRSWRVAYSLMGGPRVKGITGCSVVTPDLSIQLGNTGSAFVWEMFESIAYDPERFAKMLDDALYRFEDYRQIQTDPALSESKRKRLLARHKRKVKRAISQSGRFHLPPAGFRSGDAIELFTISGDLP